MKHAIQKIDFVTKTRDLIRSASILVGELVGQKKKKVEN